MELDTLSTIADQITMADLLLQEKCGLRRAPDSRNDPRGGLGASRENGRLAFKKTLLPCIDPVQRDKVMRRAWFTGKELTDR